MGPGQRSSTTVVDHFPGCTREEAIKLYDSLLERAEDNASKSNEMQFVAEMRQKFDDYGHRAFLSEGQMNWIKRLAKED